MERPQEIVTEQKKDKVYVIKHVNIPDLSDMAIAKSYGGTGFENLGYGPIEPVGISIDQSVFAWHNVQVMLIQQPDQLVLTCGCDEPADKLCSHQCEVLLQVTKRPEWRIFFDAPFRYAKLRLAALDYGLENETDLLAYFNLKYEGGKAQISPQSSSLFAATSQNIQQATKLLIPETTGSKIFDADTSRFIILKQHKFYRHLMIDLYHAPRTKDGQIKNPLTPVQPLELLWQTSDPLELKFFASVSRFQHPVDNGIDASAIAGLKAIVKNPQGWDVYLHDNAVSESISANSVVPIKLKTISSDTALTVERKDVFFEFSGTLDIGGQEFNICDLKLIYGCFIRIDQTLYLVKDMAMRGVVQFFSGKAGKVLVHQSKFKDFSFKVLSKLEETTAIRYPGIKEASEQQLKEQGFDQQAEKIIYLSDFGPHVMIVPVMRYGEVEISVRTKRQIYSTDNKGNPFLVQRDDEAEINFTALLMQQHQNFPEQLDDELYYFYLHRKYFLDPTWFLNVFEEWQNQGITILGFSELTGNKLNPDKINVTVQVQSGINWFNVKVKAKFGRHKANMKSLYKAIRNKNKFVQLDDGSVGILPEEWLNKFAGYFNAGEILDNETFGIPKVGFASIDEMFDDEMLDETVRLEIKNYQQKLLNFESIQNVPVPQGLNAQLRSYQQEGLNWLNFLDDFNFGGVLADDMGLGKTLQIIAFVLSQRNKSPHNTNLLVVPTSLLFNWQAEVLKFAPSIKILTLHGAERVKSITDFDQFEIILTSYGTLLSDVNFLKSYDFNYIFLDESQHIKNPNSQRYKAARLLQSRNKIAITGTPIENNTFDLYGQLSFACPGLLGSKQYFKDIYSMPIDKFKVTRRSVELQKKVQPFILRRTKQQVAQELPDKTEMVLYCEMQEEQRKVYQAYEKEFRELVDAKTEDEVKRSSMYVLKGLTKLRQICDSPLLLEGEKVPGNASVKLDALLEQIDAKAPYNKILVFSQFVGMLNLIRTELEKRNVRFSYLTGATKNREAAVNEFQNDEAVRVFLISLKAGGTGLNLTAANYVFLVDPWWNPAIENQAIDRSYRIGQHKNVIAVRMICPDTIEEKMVKLQESKRDLAGKLIQSDTSMFQSLTKGDLLALLNQP